MPLQSFGTPKFLNHRIAATNGPDVAILKEMTRPMRLIARIPVTAALLALLRVA